jgi:hypothetical protein
MEVIEPCTASAQGIAYSAVATIHLYLLLCLSTDCVLSEPGNMLWAHLICSTE